MARKKKNTGKKRASAAAQKAGNFQSRGTPAPVRKRKSSRYLTLAIMGGAAFFGLRACTSSDSDERFYTSVQECADDGNARGLCDDAWKTAKRGLTAGVDSHLTYSQCLVQYSTYRCDYDPAISGYVPVLAGFTLAKAKEKTCDPQYENCATYSHFSSYYTYHSGGQFWASRPVWRDRSGEYVYRSGETADRHVNSQSLHKAKTVSRGGWGSSSRSFSSRGG